MLRQVESLTSNKQGRQSVIVDRIGYDKEGHTVYTKLGNGTETTYTYDKQRERLQAMNLTADGQTVMENRFRYDAVDNILGITNAANPTSLTKLNKAKLGGRSSHTYEYDELNRLIHASGKAKRASYDMVIWIQTPRSNTTPNTNPGPPVSWDDPTKHDDPQAGYGYIPNDTTKEETFFYHSDHLGSTSYITDDKANITQYDAYLPYGELLVDEHSSSEDLPYKFNGKQFDEETGLYYYGARCMNPKTSLWYGVDPLAEKYVSISPYSYCKSSPMNYIDEKGLYPKGIVTIHYERSIVTTAPSITGATMNVPTQYVYYKFTKSATHLLSLVSGVPENYIKNVRLEEFNLQRESNSITLSDSPENTRMLVSPEYFNEENISKEQYYNWWFKEFSHEVGHIKQIKRDGSEGLYLLKTLWGYVSTQSHDKAPREQEAEKGSEVFESFRDFVKSKFHANLNRLFIGKGSEEEKIRQIDKWWNAYKEQKK